MYVSRLNFHTLPGKTHDLEKRLRELERLVQDNGGARPRVLRTHFASTGSPDVAFEQEAPELSALEDQMRQVTESDAFRQWSQETSDLLREPPKREVYLVMD